MHNILKICKNTNKLKLKRITNPQNLLTSLKKGLKINNSYTIISFPNNITLVIIVSEKFYYYYYGVFYLHENTT